MVEHAGGPAVELPARTHAAHEEVEHAAEVRLVVVARQAAAEVTVQGDGVEQVLQVIAMGLHRRLQARGGVVDRLIAEVVGLPVQDPEAAVVLEHQVDEALEVAVEVGEGQPRHAITLPRQPGVELRRRQPRRGQVEAELDQAAASRNAVQAQRGGGAVAGRQQGRGEHVREQAAQHARESNRRGLLVLSPDHRAPPPSPLVRQPLRVGGERAVDRGVPACRFGEAGSLEHRVHAVTR